MLPIPDLTWQTTEQPAGAKTVLVSECLEFGITVQGSTKKEVTERTHRKLNSHIALSKHLGRDPFSWLKPSFLEQAQHVSTTTVHAYKKNQSAKKAQGR